jgi:hypothetical protein
MTWIEREGPSPTRPWRVAWRRTQWRTDGTTTEESGECTVAEFNENRAFYAASLEVRRGLESPYSYWLKVLETGSESNHRDDGGYPEAVPPKETLRAWAADGQPLSMMLRALTAQAPGLSPLAQMIAVQRALFLELNELTSVAAFCRGSLSAAELDAALGPVITTRKARWALPLDLYRARASDTSIGPVLHQYYAQVASALALIRGVRDAFGLSLDDAKLLIDAACDRKRDSELDMMLEKSLAATSARRRGR